MNKIKINNQNCYEKNIYNLPGFEAQIIDKNYLSLLGLKSGYPANMLEDLEQGSILLKNRFKNKIVIPKPELFLTEIDVNSELEVHNYTGSCPVLTYEINPVSGCNVGCLYCLVTDGVHENKMSAYVNYKDLVSRVLVEKRNENHFFYFSPKTEAFQEPTLQTGIAHDILLEFIRHFEKYPDSRARLFIASKAGTKQLLYKHKGNSILDLLKELKTKSQFNTSVAIMPENIRQIIEPNAATIIDRLDAVKLCQNNGIISNSALVQPIIIQFLNNESIHKLFAMLRDADIKNYKPEFLTLSMENLAVIGQILGYENKTMEKELYENYLDISNEDHKKQRGRTAPKRNICKEKIDSLIAIGNSYGLSISICYWVRKELNITEDQIPIINSNGFQCLGYQTELFNTETSK